MGEKFSANYITTIGADFSFKQIDLEEDQINTSIWDLGKQNEDQEIPPLYYKGSAGAIVMFLDLYQYSMNLINFWTIVNSASNI